MLLRDVLVTYTFVVSDENDNPLPAGATITKVADTLKWTQPTPEPTNATEPSAIRLFSLEPSVVPRTPNAGGTAHTLIVNAGSCTAKMSGSVTLRFTSPSGESVTRDIQIN